MSTAPARPARPDPDLLPRTLAGLVRRLPTALLGSVLACLGATLAVLLAPGLTPVAVLVQAPLLAVASGPLLSLGDELALGRDLRLRASLRAAWGAAPRLALLGAVVGVTGALALVAEGVWASTGAPWVLACLAVGLATTVVAVLVACACAPLVVALPEAGLADVLAVALQVVARRPLPLLGTLAVTGLGVWAGVAWTASLLLLVPAPALVALCGGVWTSVLRLGLAHVEPAR